MKIEIIFFVVLLVLLFVSVAGIQTNQNFVWLLISTSSLIGFSVRQLYDSRAGASFFWKQITHKDKIVFLIGNTMILGCSFALVFMGYSQWQNFLVFVMIILLQYILYLVLGSQSFRKIILPSAKTR